MSNRTRYNPGNLDQRVTFLKMGRGADGRPTEVEAIPETWANVRLPSSIRTDAAGEINLTKELVITIRVRPDFVPNKDMRVLWRGDRYVINSVPPNIDKRYQQVRVVYED